MAPRRSAASLMRCWSSNSLRKSPRSGLRRGLAQLLADAKKPQACIVADALLVAAIGSAVGMAILIAVSQGHVSDDRRPRTRPLLAITVLAIAWTDIALAALAYHHDVASTVRARSIVQPWTISIAAFGLYSSSVSPMTG